MATQPSVETYRGDSKTLLAFDLPKDATPDLAGFTIECEPAGRSPYYLHNMLRFETPGDHAQDGKESPNSSINAPLHKFRWLHVPGSIHQGTKPFIGAYTYTVTPRYFDGKGSLQPIDRNLSLPKTVQVEPFEQKDLEVGFTRGFTQSQAFVNHFGLKAQIRPKDRTLIFDTSQIAGKNAQGETYTFRAAYEWLGFTAREKIFALIDEVIGDESLRLDVFAYDLNEPDLVSALLQLAKKGRVRVILDDAALHHASPPKPEDEFERLFRAAATGAARILRGKFSRYAHDKVFIVRNGNGPLRVLTGSTNFSVTGLYVNSNHVLVFNDLQVAETYAQVFDAAWKGNVQKEAFLASGLADQAYPFTSSATPATEISFSPHSASVAGKILGDVAARIAKEGARKGGSVFFAVMEMGKGTGPVLPALEALHRSRSIFSYGISDSPGGIQLYTPGKRTGVLVTGKPVKTKLPPPFSQVPGVGVGHQIHHKFVVCGFNGDDPVVYCGSSNLALGGEESNGDNLIAIHDRGLATVFVLEALGLVDHFDFLDRCATGAKKRKAPAAANKTQAASSAGWFLSTDDKWARPYYDPRDLHCADRELFG